MFLLDVLGAALDDHRAEVAFTITNDFQGRGLGTILLGQLAGVAVASGIQTFEAEVVAANHAMLHVFRESGFHIEVSASAGQLHVPFPTSFTGEAIEKFERRESIAAVNALKLFFNPRSVAVIGASRKRGSIGGELFRNVLRGEFRGVAYPVNRSGEPVAGVRAYRSIAEIGEAVDLAVICLPGDAVLEAAEMPPTFGTSPTLKSGMT